MIKKIVIAPDSFKGTMSSLKICDIIEEGINRILPGVQVVKIPIADGGEGTVDAFLAYGGGQKVPVKVKDPLFRDMDAYYGILPEGTAVIEIAAASGLPLVEDQKNPCLTSTFGTGQLITHALESGCRKFIIGLGGSATNDAGIGMASALGVKFTDARCEPIPLTGEGLEKLYHINCSGLDDRIKESEIQIACDVTNPLYGENGAAYVFAPQKGADFEMVKYLDRNLRHFSNVVFRETGIELKDLEGGGAAGGLAAAFYAFTGAAPVRGIDLIMDYVNFDSMIQDADLIITGEGKIDEQTLEGKAIMGIMKKAEKWNVPVIVIAGSVGNNEYALYKAGAQAIFSTIRRPSSFEMIKLSCIDDLRQTIEAIMRMISIFAK